jgi:hypothetical protein
MSWGDWCCSCSRMPGILTLSSLTLITTSGRAALTAVTILLALQEHVCQQAGLHAQVGLHEGC